MWPRTVICLVIGLSFMTPAGAAGAPSTVTLGRDLASAPDASYVGCAPAGCTLYQSETPEGELPTSPSDGVIVRWRTRNASPGRVLRLRVLTPGSTSSAIASSEPFTSAGTGVVETRETRLAIRAGQTIGLDAPDDTRVLRSEPDAKLGIYSPVLPDTPGSPSTLTTTNDRELLVNADIESDEDRDGYGDVTQDRCPTDRRTTGTCLVDLRVGLSAVPLRPGGAMALGLADTRPFRLRSGLTAYGPSAVTGTRLTVALPPGVAVVESPTATGPTPAISATCTTAPGLIACTWLPYPLGSATSFGGAEMVVPFGIRVLQPVTGTITARAESDLVDTDAADNVREFPIRVGPPRSSCWATGATLGTTGADRLTGSRGRDRLLGLTGDDVIRGGAGTDCLDGGAGRDTLVDRSGRSRIYGGANSDTIDARNKRRDVIDCGSGTDRAKVDKIDRPRNCERIRRY